MILSAVYENIGLCRVQTDTIPINVIKITRHVVFELNLNVKNVCEIYTKVKIKLYLWTWKEKFWNEKNKEMTNSKINLPLNRIHFFMLFLTHYQAQHNKMANHTWRRTE